jgi:hypothetical protein
MNELTSAAEILEKAAAYIEAVETEKLAAVTAERTKAAEVFKSRYAEVTGEQLSDDVVSKLASAEPTVLSLIEKLAGNGEAPVSLGGPGSAKDGPPVFATKKEAAAAADDRLAAWLSQ